MAQKRFGIILNNGKAISGAGVFVLLVTFLVFFPCAVCAVVIPTMAPLSFELVATSLGLLVGPGLATFLICLLLLRLVRVPFLRPAHEVEGPSDAGEMGPFERTLMNVALTSSEVSDKGMTQAGGGKLWWVWRAIAGIMATGLIFAGVKGLILGSSKAFLLLGVGVAAAIVAITGRDVVPK